MSEGEVTPAETPVESEAVDVNPQQPSEVAGGVTDGGL